MKAIFWVSLLTVFYTFIGYGIVLFFMVKVKRFLYGSPAALVPDRMVMPSCTLIVAAYNEADFIEQKIENTLSLLYPEDQLKLIFITDGSSDATPDIVSRFPQIRLLHNSPRLGKIAAIHRAMQYVNTEVVVFTDANTFLNQRALLELCKHYSDGSVGAIAGEKRVQIDKTADASSAGEGFYWKYESALKKWDSELYSVVGAAGELFSIRTALYEPVSADTVLDDFMISMLIAASGYRILYEPEAYAMESASANVTEELKRKVRIAAGGIQAIVRLKTLLNPRKHPMLSFQYISHRVLRWTITPCLLIAALLFNGLIVLKGANASYDFFLVLQLFFYALAMAGYLMEKRKLRFKPLFVPYYFCMMNYAVLKGTLRYFTTKQTAVWEKAQRKQSEVIQPL